MRPEEDSSALIAGREDGRQRSTSPPSGSKLIVDDQLSRGADEFSSDESTSIIRNRSNTRSVPINNENCCSRILDSNHSQGQSTSYSGSSHHDNGAESLVLPHRKGDTRTTYPTGKYLDPCRPYKCEVCKESHTQKNILLAHYNSVGHLRKLKKASSQDSQTDCATAVPAPSPTLKLSPPSNQMPTPTFDSSTDDDQTKPYKCAICKESYSQVTTLNLHTRSAYHLTRVSKLQESANGGPEPTTTTPSVSSGISSPVVTTSYHGTVSCPRSNAPFINQEQHHRVFGLSNAAAAFSIPQLAKLPSQGKKPPSRVYKHLLECFGSDLVTQFNESHQREKREKILDARTLSEHESSVVEEKKDHAAEIEEEEEEIKEAAAGGNEFPEKSTCAFCTKEFSTVWVLKAHCEQVHHDWVPPDFLEKYAQQIKRQIDMKVPGAISSVANDDHYSSSAAAAEVAGNLIEKDETLNNQDDITPALMTAADACSSHRQDNSEGDGAPNTSTEANVTADDNCMYDSEEDPDDLTSTPNPPTACSTPTSSTTESSIPSAVRGLYSSNPSANIPTTLAQQMNEMQAALSAMAASQIKQPFNPIMIGMAGLGMGLPVALPPLLPMMMPPPPSSFDSIVGLGQVRDTLFSQQSSNTDTSSVLAIQQQQQQQHLIQQRRTANGSQRKRVRTRITDNQLKMLRAHLDIYNSPSEQQINNVAAESGLPPKVIKHWFRNTLFKERQRNKDSPYNFNNPPSTTLNLEECESTGEAQEVPPNANNAVPSSVATNMNQTLKKSTSWAPSPKIDQITHLPQQQQQQQQNIVPSESAKFDNMLAEENRVKKESAHNRDPYHPVNSPNIFDCNSHNARSCGNSYSSSNSSGGSVGKRANRTRFTYYQVKVLQEFFESNAYPMDDDLEYLSRLLGLSARVIVVWFQNARQKARRGYENPVTGVDENTGRSRHQKTHRLKRSAAVPSSDDSNSSVIVAQGQQQMCNATTPNSPAAHNNPTTPEPIPRTLRCENCNVVFPKFEMWTEHQLVHIMNPDLFPNHPPAASPVGILHQQQQQQSYQGLRTREQFQLNSNSSTPKMNANATENASPSSPRPLLTTFNPSKRVYEEYSDRDFDPSVNKRGRTRISSKQLDYLYQTYQTECNPSGQMLQNIAHEVGLEKRVVQVWFQNTRARRRRGQLRANSQVRNKENLAATNATSRSKKERNGGGGRVAAAGASPLDLSNPVDLSSSVNFPAAVTNQTNAPMNNSYCDNNYGESECSENMDEECEADAAPESGSARQQLAPEALNMLQQLYGFGLATGFPPNFLHQTNAAGLLETDFRSEMATFSG